VWYLGPAVWFWGLQWRVSGAGVGPDPDDVREAAPPRGRTLRPEPGVRVGSTTEPPSFGINLWLGEIVDYTYSVFPQGCVPGKKCGHYTQVGPRCTRLAPGTPSACAAQHSIVQYCTEVQYSLVVRVCRGACGFSSCGRTRSKWGARRPLHQGWPGRHRLGVSRGRQDSTVCS